MKISLLFISFELPTVIMSRLTESKFYEFWYTFSLHNNWFFEWNFHVILRPTSYFANEENGLVTDAVTEIQR